MILTDTTVVIAYLRAPTVRLVKIIQTHYAAISCATLSEVYAGARLPADFKKYDKALSLFGVVAIRKKTWPIRNGVWPSWVPKGHPVPGCANRHGRHRQ